MNEQHEQRRELDAEGRPLATTAGPDPGNTDPAKLTAALDPDDDATARLALYAPQSTQAAGDTTP